MQSQLETISKFANSNGRLAQRRRLRLVTTASPDGSGPIEATILDLSEQGFLAEASGSLAVGDKVEVLLPEAGAVAATVVWGTERYYGCAFEAPVSRAAVAAALLRAHPEVIAPKSAERPPVIAFPQVTCDDEAAVVQFGPATRLAIVLGSSALLWCAILVPALHFL